MAKMRRKPEEINIKLQQVAVLVGQGMAHVDYCGQARRNTRKSNVKCLQKIRPSELQTRLAYRL